MKLLRDYLAPSREFRTCRLKSLFAFVVVCCMTLLLISHSAAAIKSGQACSKLNLKKVVSGYNFTCIKSGTKLVWKKGAKATSTDKKNSNSTNYAFPVSSPDLELTWEGMKLWAKVIMPPESIMAGQGINGVKARVKFGTVSLSTADSVARTSSANAAVNFNWDLSTVWKTFSLAPWLIYVEAELMNSNGSGPMTRKEIDIPSVLTPTPAPTPAPTPSPTPTPTPSVTPKESVNQSNARKSAANYLSFTAFSRSGLIKQLEYEGYSRADAEYGVDAQRANWSEQARKSAAKYLSFAAFSYSGLLNQLLYEGFSLEQATFGVDSTGLTKSTPTQSPSPTPKPTPSPSTSAAETGCQVLSGASLPFGNQRITVTEVKWEKDKAGYVSALFTMRNDNTMSLRLVQFTFYVFSSNTIVTLAQTLKGENFFIKNDPSFNSIDGATGAWLPGQTRVFRLPTNEILECGSIRYTSSAFKVLQGIGDS